MQEPQYDEPAPVAPDAARVEIGRHLPLLGVLKTQVEGAARQVEDAVVALCLAFQEIADQAKSGVSRVSEFLSESAAGDRQSASVGDLIGRAQATFEDVLRALGDSAEISRQAVRRMQEIDDNAENICGALKLLEDIGERNQILALNARIEAAHAGVYGKGFEVVATEVISQADRSHAVINQVRQTIQGLRANASSALTDLTQMSQQGLASAEAERSEVERTLEAFNDVHQEMRVMLQSSSEDSIRLSERIGRVVQDMQFQDRVNQRLNHVVEALSDSHARLAGICGEAETVDKTLIDEIMAKYTMHEERSVADHHESEAMAGDVELF